MAGMVEPFDHKNVYGGVPPVGFMNTKPRVLPLHIESEKDFERLSGDAGIVTIA